MFRDLLKGRYGIDTLNIVLIVAAGIFMNGKFTWILAMAFAGYAFFRIFSKDMDRRHQELQKFNTFFNRFKPLATRGMVSAGKGIYSLRTKYAGYKTRFDQRKLYIFLKCPQCQKTLRLPKKLGKLSVTCPVCKSEFLKKT